MPDEACDKQNIPLLVSFPVVVAIYDIIVCLWCCVCVVILPLSSFLSPPVLAELQQADLITSEECKELRDPNAVVTVQGSKISDVMAKTADVLRRHGFEKEAKHLEGKLHRSHTIPCVIIIVQWSSLCQPL